MADPLKKVNGTTITSEYVKDGRISAKLLAGQKKSQVDSHSSVLAGHSFKNPFDQ